MLKNMNMRQHFLKLLLLSLVLLTSGKLSAQWETVYFYDTLNPLPWLNSVAFKDFNNGLTVGFARSYDDNNHSGLESYILKSTDNGTTWDTVLTIDSLRLQEVIYADESTAFAVGEYYNGKGLIAKSTDAGYTWDTINVSEKISAVAFPSSNVGYAVGYNGIILKTTDAGNNWIAQNSTVSTRLNSVCFVNDSVGFACGLGIVLKTENGGTDWTSQSVDFGYATDIFFPSDSVGYFLTSDGDNMSHYIYKTTDSGNNWELLYTFSYSNMYLSSMVFTNDTTGYICGQFQMYKTTNGGVDWEVPTRSRLGSWWDDLMDLFFLNEDIGFMVGNNQFFRINAEIDSLNTGEPEDSVVTDTVVIDTTVTDSLQTDTLDVDTENDSLSVDIDSTSTIIKEDLQSGKVTIYPIPFDEYVIIEFENEHSETCIFTLFDITGNVVLRIDNIITDKIKIERNNLIRGVYIFKIENKTNQNIQGKLLIE